MAQPLTKEQKIRVRRALESDDDEVLSQLQTPEELHQLALHWNWDDGVDDLHWLIQQPFCDRGTALLLYWRSGVRYLYQYAGRDEIEAKYRDTSRYDFVQDIEQRYVSGFYTRQHIRFDPRNDDHTDWSQEYNDLPLAQPIPPVMLEPSPGEPVAREKLYDIMLRALTPVEQQAADRWIMEGLASLAAYHSRLTADDDPTTLVDAIKEIVDAYREGRYSPTGTMEGLGWLWADQLRRSYGWQWSAWDWEEDKSIGCFSPDDVYGTFPPNVVSYILDDPYADNVIRDMFDALANPSAADLRRYYMHGGLMYNTDVVRR